LKMEFACFLENHQAKKSCLQRRINFLKKN
jgi:hypothetical protein